MKRTFPASNDIVAVGKSDLERIADSDSWQRAGLRVKRLLMGSLLVSCRLPTRSLSWHDFSHKLVAARRGCYGASD